MFKSLLKILILTILFFPLFASADLDYSYPELPGTAQTITKNSQLGDVVRYLASWAIILGALAAFAALIIAGFQYLASVGNPGAMKTAQGKVFNSFLGLLILLGSYVILIIVNPQLTVLVIEKPAVVSGIVLFSETGHSEITSAPLPDSETTHKEIERLVKENKAIYLGFSQSDIRKAGLFEGGKEVGELVALTLDQNKPKDLNFDNFFLKSIGFSDEAKNIKVITYGDKDSDNEKNTASEYTYEGKLNQNGSINAANTPVNLTGLSLIRLDPVNGSKAQYLSPEPICSGCVWDSTIANSTIITEEQKQEVREKNNMLPLSGGTNHPPLSFEVKTIVPGVYLYADKIGLEKYLGPNQSEDFTKTSKDFNDEAKYIEIKNDGVDHDYIAVLHDNDNYTGQLRIFFEKKSVRKDMSIKENPPGSGTFQKDDLVDAGNLNYSLSTNPKRVEFRDIADPYGKVNKVSSINVFELSSDPSVCKKVTICNTANYGELGGCIIYTNAGENITQDKASNEYIAYHQEFLPLYKPENIPETKNLQYKKLKGDNSDDYETVNEDIRFNNEIRSIKILGGCLVVLFENGVENQSALDISFWEGAGTNRGPGGHSMIFYKDNKDLSGSQIGKCGGVLGIGGFGKPKPCASAIAIYPIKGFFGGGF